MPEPQGKGSAADVVADRVLPFAAVSMLMAPRHSSFDGLLLSLFVGVLVGLNVVGDAEVGDKVGASVVGEEGATLPFEHVPSIQNVDSQSALLAHSRPFLVLSLM